MTGFGKAEALCNGEKYTLELRSVNGKSCDVSLKSQILPREKEPECRQRIARALVRGNIDLFITAEKAEGSDCRTLNAAVAEEYLRQIRSLESRLGLSAADDAQLLQTLLRLPDVFDTRRSEPDEAAWQAISQALDRAIEHLTAFRTQEGRSLEQDLRTRVANITRCLAEVEPYEQERVPAVRERILARMAELGVESDSNRLEQELIFYLEKLDINEEKVRLAQHCRYFLETLEQEPFPGKKLGFIAQEMGREINTLGSKANHAAIQKLVVMMKDELEKIKEQSLNVL